MMIRIIEAHNSYSPTGLVKGVKKIEDDDVPVGWSHVMMEGFLVGVVYKSFERVYDFYPPSNGDRISSTSLAACLSHMGRFFNIVNSINQEEETDV